MADWQVGDLALCIKGGYISGPNYANQRPKAGQVFRVLAVVWDTDWDRWFLKLENAPRNNCGQPIWVAYRFIKVTPQSEDDFDREVIDHMAGQEVEHG